MNIIIEVIIAFTTINISWIIGYGLFKLACKLNFEERLLITNTKEMKLFQKVLFVDYYRWILVNTPIRQTSEKIRILSGRKEELIRVRMEMKDSEISHHFGFWIIQCMGLLIVIQMGNISFFIILTILNILLNLYPVLVQIRNRTIIDKIIFHRKS